MKAAALAAVAGLLVACQLLVGIHDLEPLTALDAGVGDAPLGLDAPADAPPDAWPTPPSCVDDPGTCGPTHTAACCAVLRVGPASYNRVNDAHYPAQVSAFVLDRYEVTVARFRAFVRSGTATRDRVPAPGVGEHPRLGAGSGWDPAWDALLDAKVADLERDLRCGSSATYSSDVNADALPIVCVTWYEAFAFCAWDGGRLPTLAEWGLAAAGVEQRAYPWGSDPDPRRVISCVAPDAGSTCAPAPVGSRSPDGDTPLGFADLAGNAREWLLDAANVTPPLPCLDCAALGGDAHQTGGGSWATNDLAQLRTDGVQGRVAIERQPQIGFRCARDVR
jgi:formylglycine-generating enzyme required for sulfatase activity